MKIIIDSNADEAAMNDMKAMQEIQHENIVKYYNQFIEEKNCILFVEYHVFIEFTSFCLSDHY
jgi:serine/threonine protein kinase